MTTAVSSNGKTKAASKSTETASTPVVQIASLQAETLLIPIVGTAPLIVHRFSEKAKRQMLDNMQGKKSPKLPKDPQAEYEGAFYRFKDDPGYGFPAIGFKAAAVEASRFYDKSVTKVALRQFIFVSGEIGVDGVPLVRIDGTPTMREDVVRVGMGGTDLRYRPEFLEWRTSLELTYVSSCITRDSVLSLIDAAGMGVGVGEWRPEKQGAHGTFTIDQDREVQIISA